MIAELLALTAAMLWGFSNILVKKGLKYGSVEAQVLFSLIVNVVAFWALAFITLQISSFNNFEAILYFVVSGVASSAFARFLATRGIDRVGVTVSSPLVGSTPLFATGLAMLMLSENLTLQKATGTLLIVISIFTITWKTSSSNGWKTVLKAGPLLAAFLYGVADVLRKMGLSIVDQPILGVTVGTTAGLLAFFLHISMPGNNEKLQFNWAGMKYFLPAAATSSLALLFTFYAFSLGEVIVVAPLSNATPVFSMVLALVFLKGLEKVTRYHVLSVVLVMAGVTLITLAS